MSYFDTVIADAPLSYLRCDDEFGTPVDEGTGSYSGWESLIDNPARPTLIADGTGSWGFFSGSYLQMFERLSNEAAEVSVEFWMRPESTTTDYGIFQLGSFGNLRLMLIFDSFIGAQNWRLTSDNDYWEWPATGAAAEVRANTTHHVVVTYNAFGQAKLYLDGVRVDHDDLFPWGTLWESFGGNDWGNADFGSYWFEGDLDELAVYTYELSEERVLAHYAAGTGLGGTVYFQALNASVTNTASYVRRTGKRIAAPLTATTTRSVSVRKTVPTISVAVTATMMSSRAFLQALSTTVAVTATAARQTRKTISTATTATPSVVKRVARTLSVSSTATASLAAQKLASLILVTLEATTTATASVRRAVGKTATATATTTASARKGVSVSHTASVTVAPTIGRRVATSLSTSVSSVASAVGSLIAGGIVPSRLRLRAEAATDLELAAMSATDIAVDTREAVTLTLAVEPTHND